MATRIRKKVRSADKKRLALRAQLWPDATDNDLWLRKDRVGFTTIPRTMSLLARIMDQLAGKGFPVFSTYFSLWCRVFDEGIVEIRSDRELAFESGFSGPRGEVTWRSRMRILQSLGLISIKPGLASEMQYVLILNPILVIVDIYENRKLKEDIAYSALMARMIDIGADDLEYRNVDEEDDDGDED